MRCLVSTACVSLCVLVLVAVCTAAPAPQLSASAGVQIGAGGGTSTGTSPAAGGLSNVLADIDLPGLLRGVNSFVKLVGVFCPPLSQVLDNVIQNVTSTAFRVFGRLILRQGGLGGGGGGASGSSGSGQRVNVVLPTFPPDDDEDYDEEEGDEAASEDVDVRVADVSNSTTTTTTTTTTPSSSSESTTGSPSSEDNNIAKRHVRVTREADEEEGDQEGAESAPEPADDLSNVDDEDEADRNKRYLPFGGTGHGGSAGGSGNFLFDIIRNTADRAARTVGTVYRMVAGTENLGWGLTATSETTHPVNPGAYNAKLVAGSGATEESDEKANAPGGVVEIDVGKSVEGHNGEGIPGPITRLFVIANRGIANLVQDLILRLAQTSERLVNFKARLITSLI